MKCSRKSSRSEAPTPRSACEWSSSAKSQEEGLRELAQRVAAIQGLNLLESHAERLETTNTLLEQLVSSIDGMNQRIDMLFGKEIEFHVRQELERMVTRDVNGAAHAAPAAREDTRR